MMYLSVQTLLLLTACASFLLWFGMTLALKSSWTLKNSSLDTSDSLMDDPEMELPSSFTNSRMTLTFELSVWLSGDPGSWSDAHRFPGRPDVDTIKALMDDAKATYEALYGVAAESASLTLDYMEAEDTEASQMSLSRTDM